MGLTKAEAPFTEPYGLAIGDSHGHVVEHRSQLAFDRQTNGEVVDFEQRRQPTVPRQSSGRRDGASNQGCTFSSAGSGRSTCSSPTCISTIWKGCAFLRRCGTGTSRSTSGGPRRRF